MTDDQERSISTGSPEAEPAVKADGDTGKKRDKKVPKKERLRDRLKAAEAKVEESYERVLRVTADFENYKKRVEREMNDFRKFANESLVKEILPIVDNLERALGTGHGSNGDTLEALRKGVEMTLKGLVEGLKKFGVVPVDALEKPFDPNLHQAVSQEETDRFPENTVCQELQRGYMLNDRLLRPAMVVVSKRLDTGVDVKSESLEDRPKRETPAH